MLYRNLNDGCFYCFCVYCQVQRIMDIELGTLRGPANPLRSAGIPRMILALYMRYFNTRARNDGVFAEASILFFSYRRDIQRMIDEPVRSTVCVHLSSFAALQIVVQFDSRIEANMPHIF
jgi:hypothetical protein